MLTYAVGGRSYQTGMYGNPHSRTHSYGWDAEEAVEVARKVRPSFIVFPTHAVARVQRDEARASVLLHLSPNKLPYQCTINS